MTDKPDHRNLEREANERAGDASSSYLRAIYRRVAKRHAKLAETRQKTSKND